MQRYKRVSTILLSELPLSNKNNPSKDRFTFANKGNNTAGDVALSPKFSLIKLLFVEARRPKRVIK